MQARALRTKTPGKKWLPASRAGRWVYLLFVGALLMLIGRNLYLRQQRQAFLTAVQQGDVAEVRRRLKQATDPNILDDQGIPALAVAMRSQQVETARALVEGGASLTLTSHISVGGSTWINTQPAMVWAIHLGDVGLVAAMFERGAVVPVAHQGEVLRATIQRGNLALLRLLLGHGCDPNARPIDSPSLGDPALLSAVKTGKAEMVGALLEAGADPNVSDQAGTTPLEAARKMPSERKAMVSLLLKAGARNRR
jgi:ankyrin repeat protein